MATNNPSDIGGGDPSVLRQIERQNAALQAPRGLTTPPSVTGSSGPNVTTTAGAVRNLAPVVSGSETLFPQSTTATSNNAVTINSSINNDTGDVTTVYSTNGRITVNPINQTINQYTSVDSGVSQIVAGTGVSITSTGASGTGVVTINASTAGLGNIVSVNLNGNVSSVLRGDGTWGADANSSYGDSNVSALLASFGSNTITTTGNVSVGNISATNLGNIVGTNYDGNAANVLHGDGTWSADITDYGNSNVTALLAAFGNNTITTTGLITGDGGGLSNVPYANITGTPSLGNIASLNLDGNVSNLLTGNGTYVAIPVVPTVGNIATINLDGSSSNVLYGNGVFAPVTGGGLPLSNGNSIIDIATLDGNITLDANGNVFTFGTDGNLTTPSNLVIGPFAGGGSSILQYDNILQIVGEGSNAVTLMGWAANQSTPDSIAVIGMNTPYANGAANVIVAVGNNATTVHYWNFDNTGALTLPGNGYIVNPVNSSLDPLNPNVSTMILSPDQTYSSQSLVLDPTAPGHIHLRAPGANIDEPYANIFLGGEDSSFEVGYYNGSAPNVFIHSGGNTWTFGNDGTTTFPTGNITSNTSLQLTTTFANVKTVEYQTAGVWDLYVEDSITGSNTAASRLNVSFKDNLIDKPQVYIENTKESDGIALRWTFDENGNLNFPRDVAGNTDPFLTISGGANPRILSEDVSLAGPANLEITALNTIFTGSSGSAIKIYPDDGEVVSDGNLQIWSNAVGNTQYSWTFDDTGNLTTPGSILPSTANTFDIGNGSNYFRDSYFSGNVNADAFTTSDGGLTHSGSAVGINANAGKDIYLYADAANVGWTFDSAGNLTLPGNTVAINFANGSAAFGNIVATNLDGNVSNVLTGNGTYVALPVINANTVVWTTAPVANNSSGTAGQAAYDSGGNLYVCVATDTWAKFAGTTSW
jgi:hypothetical protein